MVQKINIKIVISGNVVECYEYERGYLKGYNKSPTECNKDPSDNENSDSREYALGRAKNMLRRKINANAGELRKFITLTFRENETDLDYCNKEFNKFIKRLRYWCRDKGVDLKYVVVVEFQKRGAVHYHMLSNLPYIRVERLGEIWGKGYVKINRIDRVDNVGAYVVKYMQKDLTDKRLEGRKSYFTSRNLKEPLEVIDKKMVETIRKSLPPESLKYSVEYDNEYLGKVRYYQYNINDFELIIT